MSLELYMGDIVYLDDWRTGHSRGRPEPAPAFFFDLADPLSYLSAERVERTLGRAEWIPVCAEMLEPQRVLMAADAEARREYAELQAAALHLPLVWPERFPGPVPCAQRAAAYAVAIGAGPQFALAASRLAFCGGFDLGDPETLAEAAAASAVPLATCLRAAGDPAWDAPLEATARSLIEHGIRELPAFRVGRHWFEGASGLLCAAGLGRAGSTRRPLAPVG